MSNGPDASGALPSIAMPSFNADKDLEAMLPSTFGGATLQGFSVTGTDFLGGDTTSGFGQMETALGLKATDVSVAMAADPLGTLDTQFAAVRFRGADSAKLLQVFQASSQASGDLVGTVNLGGTAKDDAAAAAALAVLP